MKEKLQKPNVLASKWSGSSKATVRHGKFVVYVYVSTAQYKWLHKEAFAKKQTLSHVFGVAIDSLRKGKVMEVKPRISKAMQRIQDNEQKRAKRFLKAVHG